jgi:hypothetical protein
MLFPFMMAYKMGSPARWTAHNHGGASCLGVAKYPVPRARPLSLSKIGENIG